MLLKKILAGSAISLGIASLVAATWIGSRTVHQAVTPGTVVLGSSGDCGSALSPKAPAPPTWNGLKVPAIHLQSCAEARHNNIVITIGLSLSGVLLVICGLTWSLSARP